MNPPLGGFPTATPTIFAGTDGARLIDCCGPAHWLARWVGPGAGRRGWVQPAGDRRRSGDDSHDSVEDHESGASDRRLQRLPLSGNRARPLCSQLEPEDRKRSAEGLVPVPPSYGRRDQHSGPERLPRQRRQGLVLPNGRRGHRHPRARGDPPLRSLHAPSCSRILGSLVAPLDRLTYRHYDMTPCQKRSRPRLRCA